MITATGEVVCLLTKREALGYEKSGDSPRCKNHPHITMTVANELVTDDVARWIGGPTTKVEFARAIVKVDIFREWRNKSSHTGHTVRQLVPIRGRQPLVQNTVNRPYNQRRPQPMTTIAAHGHS